MLTTIQYRNPSGQRCAMSVRSRSRAIARAFTLVDLAAIIVVVFLLLALLFPAVSHARQLARIATCETLLAHFGVQMQVYANDNSDGIPGVNTTGIVARAKNGIPGAMNPNNVPVQSFDWMTPLLQDDPNLPNNRAARFHYLLSQYRCPSQNATATLFGLGFDQADFLQYSSWPACSYLMPTYFSLWGQSFAGTVLGYYEANPAIAIRARVVPTTWEVRNDGFQAQIPQVGPPERKVFVADGTRYVEDDGSTELDVNPDPIFFGAFSSGGAWYNSSSEYGVKGGSLDWDGRPVSPGSPSQGQNLIPSYRHGLRMPASPQTRPPTPTPRDGLPLVGPELDGDDIHPINDGSAQGNIGCMNAVFFDGHVEQFHDRPSRAIDFWYPAGSVVQETQAGMTAVPTGTIIP